jgi:hypothetical protein
MGAFVSSGFIPSIIPNYIGVFLGTMKGRGTIIDVRYDSSLKIFTQDMNGESNTTKKRYGITKKQHYCVMFILHLVRIL